MTRRKEDDLSREIEQHLELEAEEQSAPNVSAEDARRAARRAFGNLAIAMEDTREAWGSMWIHRLLQDLRYASRLMRRSPVVTLVVVLSLALGIGANGAIFGAVDALMLRPLPVADPQRLVTFFMRVEPSGGMFSTWNHASFVELRDHLDGVSSVDGISDVDASNVALDSASPDGRPVHIGLVSGGYFSTLGVPARAGRVFSPADDRTPGAHPIALVSDAYRRRLALAPPDVVGHTVKLHDTTYTIVGLMPAGFGGDWVGHPVDLWIPLMMQAQVILTGLDLLTGRPALRGCESGPRASGRARQRRRSRRQRMRCCPLPPAEPLPRLSPRRRARRKTTSLSSPPQRGTRRNASDSARPGSW